MTIEKLFCELNTKPADMPVVVLIDGEYYNIIITYCLWTIYSIKATKNNVDRLMTVKDLRKDLFKYRKDLNLLTKVSVEAVSKKEEGKKDAKVFYEPKIETFEKNDKFILKVISEN